MKSNMSGMEYIKFLRQKDLADPRPWYEKGWPYMRRGQQIKVITEPDGLIIGNGKILLG